MISIGTIIVMKKLQIRKTLPRQRDFAYFFHIALKKPLDIYICKYCLLIFCEENENREVMKVVLQSMFSNFRPMNFTKESL